MSNRIFISRSLAASRWTMCSQAIHLVCAGVLFFGFSIAHSAAAAQTQADKAALPETWIPIDGYDKKSNVPHGRIQQFMYDNTVLAKTGANGRKVNVYTPPGYDKDKKYPVLYALHGIGGDQKEWMSSKPQEILDNLYAANKIVPMIVVFPNGLAMNPDKCPRDMYGSVNVQAFNDFWDKDMKDFLIPFIDKTFPVQSDKEHRAILGYSMGGMQALRFGLASPKYFTYIGALAPAFRPDVKSLNSADVNSGFKQIFLSAGTEDPLNLFPPAEAFSKALAAKGINNIFVPVQGGKHDGSTWSPGLYNFAQIVFK